MGFKSKFGGLTFKYTINDHRGGLHFKTLDDLLKYEFPKNGNPLSPLLSTTIDHIKWNGCYASIGESIHTVAELIDLIRSGNYETSNKDIWVIGSKRIRFNDAHYERKSVHSIEDVYDAVHEHMFEPLKTKYKVLFDGDNIKANSQRYQTFFTKGTKCICCGIEGSFFAKERKPKDKSWHLNLYAIDSNGKEVLMTKDHIVPRSCGGTDSIDNYQTMCVTCNVMKGNNIVDN